MSLATNLQSTAIRMVAEYGNTVKLKTTTNDGVYNPQTGSMGTPVIVTHSYKAVLKPITTEELSGSGINESEWGNVSYIATLAYDAITSMLDNNWTIDGNKIIKQASTQAQDVGIVVKVYCG